MKKQHRILILDDENKSRELLAIFVNKNITDAVIDMAAHPDVALKMLRKNKYDLLILDYEMPRINGFEVLKEIQLMFHIPHIMLVSAHRDFDFAQKGIEIGVIEYIIKPIDNRQVAKAIEKYIKLLTKEDKPEQITLQAYDGNYFVDIQNICFIEKICRNKLSVQLSDGGLHYINGCLSQLQKILPDNYIYISRQCIVNRDAIKKINSKSREICIQVATNIFTLTCSRNQMKRLLTLLSSGR
jgi:Response regulator of the LytR/AlgR family